VPEGVRVVSLRRARPFGRVNRLLVSGHDGVNLLGVHRVRVLSERV